MKQPANFSNHPGTGDRHHHPGGVLFSRAMDEMILVTLARVAERAERYDEMADFMKQRVSWTKGKWLKGLHRLLGPFLAPFFFDVPGWVYHQLPPKSRI